ncbi:hypothetical protein, partial [Adlercreutzia sp.]|uniref:hypothetical protein n=1 Tax=Adlercreutzia sp. TaxID=1872387 RepID=UPI003AEFF816
TWRNGLYGRRQAIRICESNATDCANHPSWSPIRKRRNRCYLDAAILSTATLPGLFERLGFTEPCQIEEFYASNFYELLRNPDSGLWHLSSAALADLYRQEVERGFFDDPEEQS